MVKAYHNVIFANKIDIPTMLGQRALSFRNVTAEMCYLYRRSSLYYAKICLRNVEESLMRRTQRTDRLVYGGRSSGGAGFVEHPSPLMPILGLSRRYVREAVNACANCRDAAAVAGARAVMEEKLGIEFLKLQKRGHHCHHDGLAHAARLQLLLLGVRHGRNINDETQTSSHNLHI